MSSLGSAFVPSFISVEKVNNAFGYWFIHCIVIYGNHSEYKINDLHKGPGNPSSSARKIKKPGRTEKEIRLPS